VQFLTLFCCPPIPEKLSAHGGFPGRRMKPALHSSLSISAMFPPLPSGMLRRGVVRSFAGGITGMYLAIQLLTK